MSQSFIGKWGFIIAGIVFLIAAFAPLSAGRTMNAAFLVIGIACMILGGAIVRKNRAASPPPK